MNPIRDRGRSLAAFDGIHTSNKKSFLRTKTDRCRPQPVSNGMNNKRTKIVATLGPASQDQDVILKMIEAGANVFRFNFSHGDYRWHERMIETVRGLGEKLNVPLGVMADLQGPRIRVGNTKEFEVKKDEIIFVSFSGKSLENFVDKKILFINFPQVAGDINIGDKISIEDGMTELAVEEKKGDNFLARVLNDGIIKPSKGINIPSISSELGVLTEKDKKDLEFAVSQSVDFVALSFVGSGDDLVKLKAHIKELAKIGSNLPQVIAKIEKESAIANFDSILKATDVIMVARGDLGIEVEESKVPIFQKEIIHKCLRSAKPVIVATQMLNSMIENPRPTRAEVSDVSNAVVDHADAVMLSGETASGKYPVKTVQMMSQIIKETEKSPFDDLEHKFLGDEKTSLSAAVADTAHELAKNSGVSAIVAASISGFTARMVARHRPDQKLIVMTNNEKTYNQLSLVWGVESYILPDCETLDALIDESISEIKKRKVLKEGDKVVIVTGRPHTKKEHMSLVKVQEIK